jgi:glycosyltransferase involved in cell wall biosynthesis
MRIAQIAPLAECCPPQLYGGTERIVSCLTEELVRHGHDVTLFASGDSKTSAKLVPCCERALRLHPTARDPLPFHLLMLDQVRRRAQEFDVLHFHSDLLHFPQLDTFAARTVTTLHGRLDLPGYQAFFARFAHAPLVSISENQRAPMPPVNWLGTVRHGLPLDTLPFDR